jgi:hypothetical protein
MVMSKFPTVRTKRSFDELSKFVSRQDVIDALGKAGKNKALFRKAKADPKAFFRGESIKIPPRTELTIARRAVGVSGQISICVQVCRVILGFTVCVQVCIVIVFQA